jgi:hypothetical protein
MACLQVSTGTPRDLGLNPLECAQRWRLTTPRVCAVDQDIDQRNGLRWPLLLAHGAPPMDSREVMLTNV